MRAVVVSDIDGTLCVSGRGEPNPHDMVVVDSWRGGWSGTTKRGYLAWKRMSQIDGLIPVSARRVDQFIRMEWPGVKPRLAVLLNGATILVDGRVDQAWTQEVIRTGGRLGWNRTAAQKELAAIVPRGHTLDVRPGLFAQRVSQVALNQQQQGDLRALAQRNGWVGSVQGRRAYLAPMGFGKADAVLRLAEQHGLEVRAAAGDTAMDVEMLLAAPCAVCPAGSEAHRLLSDTRTHAVAGSGAGQVALVAEWLADRLMPTRGDEACRA